MCFLKVLIGLNEIFRSKKSKNGFFGLKNFLRSKIEVLLGLKTLSRSIKSKK